MKKGNSRPPSYSAVRTGGELYVEYKGDPRPEYYNTVTDPREESNDPGTARTAALSKVLDGLKRCGKPGAVDCWTAAHLR
jgi:N-acetylglucosamine-6-sulfatase